MCKAISEGGQRCHSHAVQAFIAAKSKLDRRDEVAKTKRSLRHKDRREVIEQYHRAGADLASTEAGRAHLVATWQDSATKTWSHHDVANAFREQMMRGLALADHYEHLKNFGQQDAQERQAATTEIAARGSRIADTLRKAAILGRHIPANAAFAYGAMQIPGPAKYVATGLVLVNIVSGTWVNRRRIVPTEKRTTADRGVHAMIAERVLDERMQGYGPLHSRFTEEMRKH